MPFRALDRDAGDTEQAGTILRSATRALSPQILGFLYLFLIRLPGSVCLIVWGSITCIFLLFLGMGFALVQLGEPLVEAQLARPSPESLSRVR